MASLPSDAGTEGAMGAHSTYPLLLAPTFFFTFRHHCSANKYPVIIKASKFRITELVKKGDGLLVVVIQLADL